LSGILGIDLSSFQIAEGQTFLIISGSSIAGTFSSISQPGGIPGSFVAIYNPTNVELEYIPEPATVSIIGSASLLLLKRRRRTSRENSR
jgi:hypothetical protein